MARFISVSRFLALGAAFVSVMSFAGALLGAIGGILLVLLGRAVFGVTPEVLQLVSWSAVIGVLAFAVLAVELVAPYAPGLALQPAALPANTETN